MEHTIVATSYCINKDHLNQAICIAATLALMTQYSIIYIQTSYSPITVILLIVSVLFACELHTLVKCAGTCDFPFYVHM